MAYLDHIVACNAHDLSKFRPFTVQDRQVGWIRHDVAGLLAEFPKTFHVSDGHVALNPKLSTPQARDRAVDEVCVALAERVGTPRLRGERYQVVPRWGAAPLLSVDRGVVSLFGVRAFGVHVNGMVRADDGLHLWIGRRALDKSVAPGKLDNMIAGGQSAGYGVFETLIKEAAEEADVPEAMAKTARAVGAITYCFEDEWGLKPDIMFCFDLDVPPGFTPRNTDGEISDFQLMPVGLVAATVRETNEFKFNVNLVITDFLLRHGVLTPDAEPDYVEIVRGLRRGL